MLSHSSFYRYRYRNRYRYRFSLSLSLYLSLFPIKFQISNLKFQVSLSLSLEIYTDKHGRTRTTVISNDWRAGMPTLLKLASVGREKKTERGFSNPRIVLRRKPELQVVCELRAQKTKNAVQGKFFHQSISPSVRQS